MRTVIVFFAVLVLTGIIGCSASNQEPLETVRKVDVSRYTGKWYEIARLPFSRQANCICTTAEYSIIDSSTLKVINSCYDTTDNSNDAVEGKAFVVENSGNAKLKVQFFWPFKGDYWIIDLDTLDYSYAVVGMPSRKYAWILSRTQKLDAVLFERAKAKLKETGFAVEKLIVTKQTPVSDK